MFPKPTMTAQPSGNGTALLSAQDVYAGYLDFDILKGVSLHVNAGEMVCVIGPNGAGKSTVFKAIYGLLDVRQGHVLFDGQEITRLATPGGVAGRYLHRATIAQRFFADDRTGKPGDGAVPGK